MNVHNNSRSNAANPDRVHTCDGTTHALFRPGVKDNAQGTPSNMQSKDRAMDVFDGDDNSRGGEGSEQGRGDRGAVQPVHTRPQFAEKQHPSANLQFALGAAGRDQLSTQHRLP